MGLLLFLLLQQAGETSEEDRIRLQVEALGSEEIVAREKAYRFLLEKGEAAENQVQEALWSSDAEVRARCRALLRIIDFEPGARETPDAGKDGLDTRPDPDLMKRYEEQAAAGKIDAILKEDYKWVASAIEGLLSDSKPVAFASLRVLRFIRAWRQPAVEGSALERAADLKIFRRAKLRAAEYACWVRWWNTEAAYLLVSEWEFGADPGTENWENTLRILRGGKFDDRTTPEYGMFRRVKRMGDRAYPFLVVYIDHEDTALGRAAVDVLKRMTGRESPPVTDGTKAAVRATWERWLRTRM